MRRGWITRLANVVTACCCATWVARSYVEPLAAVGIGIVLGVVTLALALGVIRYVARGY